MSFTEDELQAFNTVLERRLSAQRREMERTFDQHMNALRRDIDQRFDLVQQEIVQTLTRQLSNQQNNLNATLSQKLDMQEKYISQAVSQETERGQQHIEEVMDRALAAQLLGIEQLIGQQLALQSSDDMTQYATGEESAPPRIEAIEVQTDLPWEDLVDVFGKVLDARFAVLNESIQSTMKNWEQYLSARLHSLRGQTQPYNGDISTANNLQDVLGGIEHLERVIESMQVVMTTNHALLSNRLYHHQQLPLERAHPSSRPRTTPVNGVADPLSLPGEREQ